MYYEKIHVLTSETFHPTYDALFENMGQRQAEAFIEGIMAFLEELIWLRDENGNFKELTQADIPLIKSILNKHLGSKLGNDAWLIWNRGVRGSKNKRTTSFISDLNEFNARRRFIMDSDGKLIEEGQKNLLFAKFLDFATADWTLATSLNPELFLGSRGDFIYMNFVYLGVHRFDLSNL